MASAGAASPFIVRADVLDALHDGDAIRSTAHREAKQILAKAEEEAAAMREDAHARGMSEGATEAATLIAEAGKAAERFLLDREGELREVAFAVAHRILASLPRDETTQRLASEAIAEYGRDLRLVIRASPEVADRLRLALDASSGGERVTIVADPSSEPGACTLVHTHGRTDIGLLAQFRALMAGGARRQSGGVGRE